MPFLLGRKRLGSKRLALFLLSIYFVSNFLTLLPIGVCVCSNVIHEKCVYSTCWESNQKAHFELTDGESTQVCRCVSENVRSNRRNRFRVGQAMTTTTTITTTATTNGRSDSSSKAGNNNNNGRSRYRLLSSKRAYIWFFGNENNHYSVRFQLNECCACEWSRIVRESLSDTIEFSKSISGS